MLSRKLRIIKTVRSWFVIQSGQETLSEVMAQLVRKSQVRALIMPTTFHQYIHLTLQQTFSYSFYYFSAQANASLVQIEYRVKRGLLTFL